MCNNIILEFEISVIKTSKSTANITVLRELAISLQHIFFSSEITFPRKSMSSFPDIAAAQKKTVILC